MFAVGQQWRYQTPPELADSRIVIGAILAFESGPPIICASITQALQQDAEGATAIVAIPFVPMSETALAATVTEPDGEGDVAAEFATEFETWRSDERGLSHFTVPFEGSLDRMIARQMAAIVRDRTEPPASE